MLSPAERRAKIRAVIRVASCNFIEAYDFIVYGYYANSIAATLGYAQIGLMAPLLIVAGRLLQGLSAGAEFGGVAIYLSEIATPGRHGLYCSWQAVSQQVAVVFAALFGFGLTAIVPPEQMTLWGWRIPLLAGIVAIPLILWLRNSLQETEVFKHSRHVRTMGEVLRILGLHWK